MPTDEAILGFSNRWYSEGIRNAQQVAISPKTKIAIFTLPYFIASKMEAFHGRGRGDFRLSHDIEDIVAVLDGQLVIDIKAPKTVDVYLKQQFTKFLNDSRFLESITGHMDPGPVGTERAKRLLKFLRSYSRSNGGPDRS